MDSTEYPNTRFIRHFLTGELIERELIEPGSKVLDEAGNLVDAPPPERSSRAAICEKRPWESTSIAVNPAQAGKFTQDLRDAGIKGASYDRKTGNLVCTSKSARREAVRLRGFHDNDGGYGDP